MYLKTIISHELDLSRINLKLSTIRKLPQTKNLT